MPTLTTREKVAHLLRRFGLGASHQELDSYTRLGVDGALNKLLHYEGVEETFNVGPWSYAFDTSPQKVSVDNSRFVAWWARFERLVAGKDLGGITIEELRRHDKRFEASALDEIRPEKSMASRASPGGTAPERVREALAEAREALRK